MRLSSYKKLWNNNKNGFLFWNCLHTYLYCYYYCCLAFCDQQCGVVTVVDLAKLRVKGDGAGRNRGGKAHFCKTEHLYAWFGRIGVEKLCMQKLGPVCKIEHLCTWSGKTEGWGFFKISPWFYHAWFRESATGIFMSIKEKVVIICEITHYFDMTAHPQCIEYKNWKWTYGGSFSCPNMCPGAPSITVREKLLSKINENKLFWELGMTVHP